MMTCWRGYLSGARCKLSAYGPADATYVDAVYCYRPSSVVYLSVCRSVTVVNPGERLNRWICRLVCDPKDRVLTGGADPPWEGAILRGERAAHCKV